MEALNYLKRHCSLRRNVLSGETMFAPQGGDDYQLLTREARNTLILEAASEGIALTDETLERFVHSTLITDWNPAEEWLDGLDAWDGTDRVADLATASSHPTPTGWRSSISGCCRWWRDGRDAR